MKVELNSRINEFFTLQGHGLDEYLENYREENEAEALDCFMNDLGFGTAGLRAEMSTGFNRMNVVSVKIATMGIAAYLKEQQKSKSQSTLVIIGFDHRRNSKLFAQTAAKVFRFYGHNVRIFPSIVPTPFVPSAIQCLNDESGSGVLRFGVMITASHNPKGDNGYKVYGGNGAQIGDHEANKISEFIAKEKIKIFTNDNKNQNLCEINYEDEDLMFKVKSWYMKRLGEWLEIFPKPSTYKIEKPSFVYTGLHGVGAMYLDQIFNSIYPDLDIKNAYVHVEQQRFPDPDFPTVEFPNPEEGKTTLKLAIERAEEVGIETIFANDPDADRFCVAQKIKKNDFEEWKVFNGNEIAVLLADFISEFYETKNEKVVMLASCVSSRFLKHFCENDKRNWKFEATPTGFKNLGNRGKELKDNEGFRILLAYEEAIGFQVGDWSFDKDGLTTLMTFYALINRSQEMNFKLEEKLKRIYEREECWPVQCNGYYFCRPAARIKTLLNQLIENLEKKSSNWCTLRAKEINYINVNGTLTLEFGIEGVGRAWLMLRSSGTEPKLKYYSELMVLGKEVNSGMSEILESAIEEIIEVLLEPEKNGLVKKK